MAGDDARELIQTARTEVNKALSELHDPAMDILADGLLAAVSVIEGLAQRVVRLEAFDAMGQRGMGAFMRAVAGKTEVHLPGSPPTAIVIAERAMAAAEDISVLNAVRAELLRVAESYWEGIVKIVSRQDADEFLLATLADAVLLGYRHGRGE